MNIRNAELADLEEIIQIYNAAIPGRMATADTNPVTLKSRLEWFRGHSQHYPLWVLEGQKEAGVERQLCWRDLFERNLYSSQSPSVLKDRKPVFLEGEGMKNIPPASCPLPPAFRGRSLGQKGIAGWLSFRPFYGRPAYHTTAEIGLYVAPANHRQGIGQQLLESAIFHSPNLGLQTLLGFIFAHNTPSLNLFQKLGFQQWGYLPQVALLDNMKRDLIILGYRVNP